MNKLFRSPEILFYYLSTEYDRFTDYIFGTRCMFYWYNRKCQLVTCQHVNVQWNKMWDINMEKELSAIPTLISKKKNQDRIAKPRTLHHPEVSIFTLYIIKLTI